jgi:hypothetical protein
MEQTSTTGHDRERHRPGGMGQVARHRLGPRHGSVLGVCRVTTSASPTATRSWLTPHRSRRRCSQMPRRRMREIPIKRTIIISTILLSPVLLAAPAIAAPQPARPPASGAGVATACSAVITNNPNAVEGTRQAQPAQENFSEVGQAFCSDGWSKPGTPWAAGRRVPDRSPLCAPCRRPAAMRPTRR